MKTKRVNLNNSHLDNYMSFMETEEMQLYTKQIRKYKPFTREEEIEAVKKAKSGNQSDFDNFVNHNLLLVVTAARHFMHNGTPLVDLIQYGNIGLTEAARAYIEHPDYYMKNRFNTYAVWYIRKNIVDGMEKDKTIIRPHMVQVNSNKIKKVIEKLNADDTIIDVETISKQIGLPIKDVQTAIMTDHTILSTNMCLDSNNEEHSDTLGDIITGDMNTDKEMMEEDRKKEIKIILSRLNNKERTIVMMRFGIGREYEMEFDTIGEILGIGTERARKIFKDSMVKLKEHTI
jgi:RNA polymerase sigma factor (sigma-70 family)